MVDRPLRARRMYVAVTLCQSDPALVGAIPLVSSTLYLILFVEYGKWYSLLVRVRVIIILVSYTPMSTIFSRFGMCGKLRPRNQRTGTPGKNYRRHFFIPLVFFSFDFTAEVSYNLLSFLYF